MSDATNCDKPVPAKNDFWNEPDAMPKLPGKVMEASHKSYLELSSKSDANKLRPVQRSFHQRSSSHPSHLSHRPANCSFECFTASCDDAWDSQIDDGVLDGVSSSSKSSLPSDASKKSDYHKKILLKQQSEPYKDVLKTSSISSVNKSNESPSSSSVECDTSKKPLIVTTNVNKPNHLPSSLVRQVDNAHQVSKKVPPLRDGFLMSSVNSKSDKLRKLIYEDEVTDLNELRKIAWAGVPPPLRHIVWKLLLDYLPPTRDKRQAALERKRTEYQLIVDTYYNNNRCPNDEVWRQIHIDIPRMQPLIPIFQQEIVQKIFQRVLYIYSIRHPACGYVQGMNDLVIPFFVVYLSEFLPGKTQTDFETFQVSTLSENILQGIEADSFWSVKKLLDSIQDNYVFAQPGIQSLVNYLEKIISRVDSNLHDHLVKKHNVQFMLFSFRWMNNLLTRELPLRCIIRLWDTYLAEGALTSSNTVGNSSSSSLGTRSSNASIGNPSPFSAFFHLYVCAAFLRYWSKSLLKEQDFQGIILFLQNLPTFHWSDTEIELLVADAYSLKETFTINHLLSS